MDILHLIADRQAEADNVRIRKQVKERDDQAQIDWDKLIELATNGRTQLAPIARTRAPEATNRVENRAPARGLT